MSQSIKSVVAALANHTNESPVIGAEKICKKAIVALMMIADVADQRYTSEYAIAKIRSILATDYESI